MSQHEQQTAFADVTEEDLRRAFEAEDYVADDEIVTTVLLALRLGKPLLIEGQPGAGKTELAKVLAGGFDTELIRLQCYEGLAAENALYEWNYTKQLLAVQAGEGGVSDGEGSVFDEDFLFERPLLQALDRDGAGANGSGAGANGSGEDGPDGIDPGDDGLDATDPGATDGTGEDGTGAEAAGRRPPVLLIDEVDRADEEFEALLLEVLSDFQVSVPELGTVRADRPPVVVITSNRTRGLSDALKRRCLYLHVEPPSFEKERAILERKVPELDGAVAAEICGAVQRLREEPFLKQPGAAETIDWARAVAQLRHDGEGSLTADEVRTTIGCLLKEVEDVQRVDDDLLEALLDSAESAREAVEESDPEEAEAEG